MPPQRERAVPWSGREILAIVILCFVVWPMMSAELLKGSGFFNRYYGTGGVSAAASDDDSEEVSLARARRSIWIGALAFPFQIATILIILGRTSDTRHYQLGLTWHRSGCNLLLGLAGFLVLTPIVHLVLWLMVRLQGGQEPHPFTRVVQNQPLPGETVMLVFSAVIAAPIFEELLFRGVLQRWFAVRPWGGGAALTAAYVVALIQRSPELSQAWEHRSGTELLLAGAPVLFVLAMVPGYWLIRARGLSPAAGAIYGTAMLFAVGHPTWPDPVPLFVLALGLGWLAHRTQSLVGPVLLHALFNAVACWELFFST